METPQIFNIPAANMEKLEKSIAKLNKKAVKAGTGEIKLHTVSRTTEDMPNGSIKLTYQMLIEGETPKIAGWTFVARINHNDDPTGESNLVYVMPGELIFPCDRKSAANCDHCGYIRRRRDTYILRNDTTGDFKQIGRTCIRDFIGHDPEKVLAHAEYISRAIDKAEEATADGWSGITDHRLTNLRIYLAHVAYAIGQYGWISKKAAFENPNKISTAATAGGNMYTDHFEKIVPSDEEFGMAEATIEHVLGLQEDSDYIHNLKVIAEQGFIDFKAEGLAASMVPLYQRHLDKDKQKIDLSGSEHIGELNKRFDTDVTIIGKRWFENYFGMTCLIRMIDCNGNLIVTFTGGNFAEIVNEEDKITVRGTVKKHDEYKGTKQTIINRAAIA